MKFCPKCGSIMMPAKDEKGNRIFKCRCGYSEALEGGKMKESIKHDNEIAVVEKDIETLPKMKEECPKCGHDEAYYWLQQTRSGDEPETKFLRCAKCKHTWRDYD